MAIQTMMPAIVKDTCQGLARYSILDEMFMDRKVECTGQITAESAEALILQLRYLQKENPEKEITMYVNSPGGEVTSGLAVYDVIQALSCPIHTVCVGIAASMAALLFISGKQRDMLPHARVMIHDPMIQGGIGGSALSVDSLSRDLMKIREITGKIIAEHTGKTLEEVFAKTASDSYFDPEEAIGFGLADRIIHKI